MAKCIMVERQQGGALRIIPDATGEDFDEVCREARAVRRDESLVGWGTYTQLWSVWTDADPDRPLLYMVED